MKKRAAAVKPSPGDAERRAREVAKAAERWVRAEKNAANSEAKKRTARADERAARAEEAARLATTPRERKLAEARKRRAEAEKDAAAADLAKRMAAAEKRWARAEMDVAKAKEQDRPARGKKLAAKKKAAKAAADRLVAIYEARTGRTVPGGAPAVARARPIPQQAVLRPVPQQAVLRPVHTIEWPDCCVGCMSPGPGLALTLNVHPATWRAAGAKIGSIAGGAIVPVLGAAVGAVVGGVAGAMAGAVANEVREYELPICSACLASLCKEEVESLEKATKERTQTKVVTRTIQKGCVILNFACRPYMEAFWAANAGRVHGTVGECRAGKRG
jgi:flagellar biosynthesis GTPase FlhF